MFWSKSHTKEEAEPAPESSADPKPDLQEPRSTTETPQELSSAAKEEPAPEEDQLASNGSEYDWRSRINTAKQLYSTANQVYTVASAIPQAKAALDPYLASKSTTDDQSSTETTEKSTEPTDDFAKPVPTHREETDVGDDDKASLSKAGKETHDEAQTEKNVAAPSAEPTFTGEANETNSTVKDGSSGDDTKAPDSEPATGITAEDQGSDAATKPSEAATQAPEIGVNKEDSASEVVEPAEPTTGDGSRLEHADTKETPVSKDTEPVHPDLVAEEKHTKDVISKQEEQPGSLEPKSKDPFRNHAVSEDVPVSEDTKSAHPKSVANDDEPDYSSEKKIDPQPTSQALSAPKTDAPVAKSDAVAEGKEVEAPIVGGEDAVAEEDVPSEPLKLVDNDPTVKAEEAPTGTASKDDKEQPEEPDAKSVGEEKESALPSKTEDKPSSDKATRDAPTSQSEVAEESAPTENPTDAAKAHLSPEAQDSEPATDKKPAAHSKDIPSAESNKDKDEVDGTTTHEATDPAPDTKQPPPPSKPGSEATDTKPAEDAAVPDPAKPEEHQPSKQEIERAADAAKAAARLQSTADALWDQARAVRDPAERERLWRAAYNKEVEAHGQSKKARAMASGWGQGAMSGVGVSAALGIGLGNVVGALLGGVVSLPGSLVGAGVGAAMGPLVKLGVVKPGPEKEKKGAEGRSKEFGWEEELSDDEEHQRIVEAIRLDEKAAAEGKK